MSPVKCSRVSADWRDLASLGEQIASATSFAVQRDCIIALTARLLDGYADLWGDENLFRHRSELSLNWLFGTE